MQSRRKILWWVSWLAGSISICALLSLGLLWIKNKISEPREAPEAEAILLAQSELPYQVLIPAYLPAAFDRNEVEIQTGPAGEDSLRLIYTSWNGVKLVLTEWMPNSGELSSMQADELSKSGRGMAIQPCNCACQNHNQCSLSQLMVDIGPLRIMAETSDPLILSTQHMQTILLTLAPASGLQVITSPEEVPLSSGLPEAVEVPVTSEGIQEVVLVVSPQGYTPVHFAVKKGMPVRVIFKQLGQVGCGNELYIEWGKGKVDYVMLESPNDKSVVEFTPRQAGEFSFHCPHYIYQGVMSVQE